MNNGPINEQAYHFLQQNVGFSKSTATWYKKTYRFHQLSMQELRELSAVSKVSIQQLIFTYGFGRSKVTLDEVDHFLS